MAASARTAIDTGDDAGAGSGLVTQNALGHLECVPYARTTSGIQIYGDAHTWWDQARGRYATGHTPRIGAVMAIKPFNNSKLGHVATVSRVVDSRTVLLSHANWSVPGQIERNVTALDVSPNNDWSQVRVWYAPSHGLGTTHWPVSGFIYNARPGKMRDLGESRLADAAEPEAAKPVRVKVTKVAMGKLRRNDPIGAIISGTY
jgi:surface antigen